MRFIGQENIMRELNYILPPLKNGIANLNLLFRAPSGYGKTTLALLCLNFLGLDNSAMYFPIKDELNTPLKLNKRFHFIDEIHGLENPEFLYPYMDRDYSFIFASNESGSLKEPLANRCVQFIFSPYTQENMEEIIRFYTRDMDLTPEMITEIFNRTKNNPRIAKILCKRLRFAFMDLGYPTNLNQLISILEDVLQIKEGGFTTQDLAYLEYLKKVGGTSSLQNIIYGTHIDRDTILREVEPFLMYSGKIIITSKGRTLV